MERVRTRVRWFSVAAASVLLALLGLTCWKQFSGNQVTLFWLGVVFGVGTLNVIAVCFLAWDHHARAKVEQERRLDSAVQQTHRLGQRRLDAVLAGTSDLVLVLNAEGRVTYSSASSISVLGYNQEMIRGMAIDELLTESAGDRLASVIAGMSDGEQIRVDLMAIRGDGRHLPIEMTLTSQLLEEIVAGYIVAIRDISHLSEVTAELARQSQHDPLTTLPNRRLFNSQLAQLLSTHAPGTIGVLVVDINNLKSVNATYGTDVGDQVLVELGARLTRAIESSDMLARLDGDEFAVILTGRSSVAMTTMAKRVLAQVSEPFAIGGHELNLRVSLGLAEAEAEATVDELVRNADVALYWAKESGTADMARYEKDVHHREIDRLVLRQELERAIRSGELKLVYQGIVDLGTRTIEGVEALVRWDHPVRGPISPAEFIPLAEQSGMMVELGSWVLRKACLAAAQLQRPGRPLRMSVNISATQLAQPDFVMELLSSLDESSLDPGLLMLEITETAVLVSLDKVVPRLAALRTLGVHVAVDDFGTGYSSLNYLTRLPLDELKIDKSFVDRLPGDAATESVVRGMLEMCTSLNLITVGEGVERQEQADWLAAHGCTLGQGYLWAKPVDLATVVRAIDSHTAGSLPNHQVPSIQLAPQVPNQLVHDQSVPTAPIAGPAPVATHLPPSAPKTIIKRS